MLWLGEKAKHDLISSYEDERKGINERFASNQLESLRLGRKNADGCFYQRGIVAYFFLITSHLSLQMRAHQVSINEHKQ